MVNRTVVRRVILLFLLGLTPSYQSLHVDGLSLSRDKGSLLYPLRPQYCWERSVGRSSLIMLISSGKCFEGFDMSVFSALRISAILPWYYCFATKAFWNRLVK